MNDPTAALPTVVIGAGPVGLAAAAHLAAREQNPLVLEAGPGAGTAVREWSHVRLFSPWAEVIDPAAEKLLAPTGWVRPDGPLLPHRRATGPSSTSSRSPTPWATRVRYGTRVTGVSRSGRDRVVDAGREEQPFTVHVRHSRRRLEERSDRPRRHRRLRYLVRPEPPRERRPSRSRRAGRRRPDRLPRPRPQRPRRTGPLRGQAHRRDRLRRLRVHRPRRPRRPGEGTRRAPTPPGSCGAASARTPSAAARPTSCPPAAPWACAPRPPSRTDTPRQSPDSVPPRWSRRTGRLVLVAEDGRRLDPVDEVIVLTGLRPDLSFLDELRLGLDERLQAPVALAPLIDPNVHSCGTVYPHGANELSHPEKDIYLAGMKSYGRAPTFLAMTGYEQVRSIAAALAGDQEAAERVELTLPETGVCGGAGPLRRARSPRGGPV